MNADVFYYSKRSTSSLFLSDKTLLQSLHSGITSCGCDHMKLKKKLSHLSDT